LSKGPNHTLDFTYEGLTLLGLLATQVEGQNQQSWKITYLYDEDGRPYAGIYRDPATSSAPTVFALITTDRGDVVELLDAAGSPFAAYRYNPWGSPQGTGNVATGIWSQATALITSTLATNIALRQPLRYAGYCYDQESGMYYLSSRHYDPKTRQFLSKDLVKADGEESAYQYCGGSPVGNVDASGHAQYRYGSFTSSAWNYLYRVKSVVTAYYTWTDAYRLTGGAQAVRISKVTAKWYCYDKAGTRTRVSKAELVVREDYYWGRWYGPYSSGVLYPKRTYYSAYTLCSVTYSFNSTPWLGYSMSTGYKLRAQAFGYRPNRSFADFVVVATLKEMPDVADPGQ
jgi:RHS repeat-associated protein